MTLANKITLGRMVSVPFVWWSLYEGHYLLAFCLFFVAALSDGVDGYVARKFGQQTALGAILDPLADKLLLTMTFIILTASPHTLVPLPAWLTVAVTYRDLLIMLGAGMVKWLCPTMQFRPIVSSKLTTFFQIATVLVVCLANLLSEFHYNPAWLSKPIHAISVITGLLCLVSVLGYYRAGVWMLATESEEPARVEAEA